MRIRRPFARKKFGLRGNPRICLSRAHFLDRQAQLIGEIPLKLLRPANARDAAFRGDLAVQPPVDFIEQCLPALQLRQKSGVRIGVEQGAT